MRPPLTLSFSYPQAPDGIRLRVFGKREGGGKRGRALPLIVYFHGGMFICGTLDDADGIAAALAEHAVVLTVDYPPAPQVRFPDTAEIAFEALQWAQLHAQELGADENDILVAGDQAGGNLAAAVAMMARDRLAATGRRFYLQGQILIAPMLDPDQTSASMQAAGDCPCQQGWAAYLPADSDALHPYAAPAQSRRLGGLVPALIITAEHDALRDEAEQYAAALIAAGVPVQVRRFEGVGGKLADPQHACFSALVSTAAQFMHAPA
jgi:acetyl esterase/lipase